MHESELITREIMGNVPRWLGAAFYASAFAALGWAGWAFFRRAALHRMGRPRDDERRGSPGCGRRLLSAVEYLTFHRQLLRDRYAGIAHLLTFYGFTILFIGTCLVFLEYDTPLHFFYGWFYRVASLAIDLGGAAFLVGLSMFLWRRYGPQKPIEDGSPSGRILKTWWVAALAWLLVAIGISGFLLEGARIARDFPDFEIWSIVGYAVALGLNAVGLGGTAATVAHRWLWGMHALLCVAFFALLPWRFFGHIVYGLASWVRRRERALSDLGRTARVNPVARVGEMRGPGATVAREFSRIDLLQADACTTCGRCNEVCPANAAGKALRPREIVLGLRAAIDAGMDDQLARWISDDAVWSCTTCSACNGACPVGIDVYDKIVELRRGFVESGAVPPAAETLFESVAARFNPFQRPNGDRMAWAQGLRVPVASSDEPVELLYWVGCAGSFDPDGQSVTSSMIRLLNHLGINYRVLGTAERCTGDPARRLGEEGLFQELEEANRATFRRHKVRRVLTHCPHCYNTFRNEYQWNAAADARSAGGATGVEVVHHTQFLGDLAAAGKLSIRDGESDGVTFHDPCYLGRGNGVVEAPRKVLASMPGLEVVEMPRHGANSFCCGAGGGSMWLDMRGRERIENIRFREAAATGATTIATGCPFCKTMLEAARQADASNAQPNRVRVRDIAELAAEALGL